ncbi:RTX toxin, putative [Shewanella sp. HN-41]|nr:RTX toxin, putative [Shewanella sp. HN-41]
MPVITYTLTDGSGANDTSTLTLDVTPVNDAPVIISADNAVVSEEGLTGGIQDTVGDSDTTNLSSMTGTINITDVDNDSLTVSLSGPTGLTSGGEDIAWSWSGNTLTGYVVGTNVPIITITLTAPIGNSSGAWGYEVTLLGPIDHADTAGEDDLPITIGISVDDGSQITTGSFEINIEDDSPVDQVDEDLIQHILNGSGTISGDLLAPGADGLGDIEFNIVTTGLLFDGIPLQTSMSGNTLTAWADINDDGVFNAGEEVFTLTAVTDINGNYDYQLELLKEIQLDKSTTASFVGITAGASDSYYVLTDGSLDTHGNASVEDTLITITGIGSGNHKVNSNSFGIGVGDPSISTGESINFAYGAAGTSAATINLGTGSNGSHDSVSTAYVLITYADGSTNGGQLIEINGTLEFEAFAQNGSNITSITISYQSGSDFQVIDVSANTIVTEDPIDIEFSYNATDNDGDPVQFGDSTGNGHFTVTIDPAAQPIATTPNAQVYLYEDVLPTDGNDTTVQTLSFKSGSNSIDSFQFGNLTNISVVGINAQIHWALNSVGQLIGTVYGREALRLTLDWDRINAGEQGDVTVTAELLTNLPHSVNANSLTVNGIQVVAVDAAGHTAHSTVTVTVADDVDIAQNDTAQLDVVTDSFSFSGIVANWGDTTGGWYVRKFDGPDNDSGNDQLRWGSTDGSQSGYGFVDNDAALNGTLALNQDIVLGTFTHYNYPIDSGSSITAATMQITFNVTDAYGVVTPVTLTLNFSHNETPNDGSDPRDIVTVGQTSVTFNYEGQMYTMQVIGFKDSNGNIVSSIYTDEDAATSYQLVVRMVAGDGYTLPHSDGNVLTNDTIGADNALEIIGVASGDHTSSGVSGHVGSTINGVYGTLVLNADGTYHYQLTASANLLPASGAVETFTYTIQDGDGDTSSATLKINVNPVNADGINIADANALTTQGSSLNDTMVVSDGERATNHNILNVTFGGGQNGIITNSNGDEIITSGSNKKSYSTTDAQVVSGGDGNDHIETGRGNDVIYAGKTGTTNYGSDDYLELSVNDLLNHHIMTGTLTGSNKIVDNDGLLLANDVSSKQADIVNGGSGDDRIYGQSGSDILYGHTGNDYIDGGSHNDALRGGTGNDTLIGGLGDDVLRGDDGADKFVWRYADADNGTDHIMDFNANQDKLDLSDLLQGETANTLENYLNFSLDNGSTVIDIDANKDGVFEQHIILDGVDLYSQYGAIDNAGIINGLLGSNGNGPLIIDTAPVIPDAPQGLTQPLDPNNHNGTIIP